MKCTFAALVQPSSEAVTQIEALRQEWPNRVIEPIPVLDQPTGYWRTANRYGYESFPSRNNWNTVHSGGRSSLRPLCVEERIIELGIVFSPARFSFMSPSSDAEGKYAGSQSNLCLTEEKGSYYYEVRSGADRVPSDSVGLFLTRKLLNRGRNGTTEKNIDFEYWESFYEQATHFYRLLRALRKLDQLRGARKDTGAFKRLSVEVSELVCSII